MPAAKKSKRAIENPVVCPSPHKKHPDTPPESSNTDTRRKNPRSSVSATGGKQLPRTFTPESESACHALSGQQRKFVNAFVHDRLPQMAAAREAGYSQPGTAAHTLLKNPKVQHAIAQERELYEREAQMTRKKVMDGFLEAIEMGKTKADPLVMISGWREVAKMCGYYEPTKHKIDISVSGQVALQRLQTMSDEELLREAFDGDGEILEGEFETLMDPSMRDELLEGEG